MTRIIRAICATGALLSLTALATMAYADGRDFNDGPVQTVTFIRTVDGHFDEYMHWLATTYKKQQEAAKGAGIITSYQVLSLSRTTHRMPTSYSSSSIRTGRRSIISAASLIR